MQVRVRNGNVDQALRSFKRKIQNDGLILEVRSREFYEKPSAKRNRKKQAAEMRELRRKD